MSHDIVMADLADDKNQLAHSEREPHGFVDTTLKTELTESLVKSRFDNLTIAQSLWTFKRSLVFTLLVYTAYIMDGYEVSTPDGHGQL